VFHNVLIDFPTYFASKRRFLEQIPFLSNIFLDLSINFHVAIITVNIITIDMDHRQRRRNNKISDEIRGLIINSMNNGTTANNVGHQFNVLPNTVRKIYSTYRRTQNTTKKSAGHRQQKLSDAQKEQICDWVDEDCSLTLQQLKTKCLTQWPNINQISLSTVNRAVQNFHYSVKRISFVPERRNTPDTIQARFDYAVQYNRIMLERDKIFFIDEYGIQVNSRVSYGRSVRNTRASKVKAQLRGRNYSIAAAMNDNSLYLFQVQDRPYNIDHFSEFITSLINHLNNDAVQGAHFVMDNVRFHRSEEVVTLIEAHGHFAVFLPPYSPFLNPIEELFNQWKQLIKRAQSTNENELYEAVHTASENISPENCRMYVQHMEACLHDCLRRGEIMN
jgi:transposase